jgi:hypothetical protein
MSSFYSNTRVRCHAAFYKIDKMIELGMREPRVPRTAWG